MKEIFYRYTYATGEDSKKLLEYLERNNIAYSYEQTLFCFLITSEQETDISKITGAVYSHN